MRELTLNKKKLTTMVIIIWKQITTRRKPSADYSTDGKYSKEPVDTVIKRKSSADDRPSEEKPQSSKPTDSKVK